MPFNTKHFRSGIVFAILLSAFAPFSGDGRAQASVLAFDDLGWNRLVGARPFDIRSAWSLDDQAPMSRPIQPGWGFFPLPPALDNPPAFAGMGKAFRFEAASSKAPSFRSIPLPASLAPLLTGYGILLLASGVVERPRR